MRKSFVVLSVLLSSINLLWAYIPSSEKATQFEKGTYCSYSKACDASLCCGTLGWSIASFDMSATEFATSYEDDSRNQSLVVKFKDGQTMSFFLSEKPEISFTSDKFNIVSQKLTLTSYNRKDIEEFYFVEITTEIDNVKQNEITFKYTDNNNVQIFGLSKDESVYIYDMNGKQLSKETANSDESFFVSLRQYVRGTYIIKIGNKHSFKIIRK